MCHKLSGQSLSLLNKTKSLLILFVILFSGFFVFTGKAEAATITAAAGGGNWSTGSTWVGGVAPTASDDAVLDATSGNVTINTTTAVAKSVNLTGYANTLTHNSSTTLTVSGSITLAAGRYSAADSSASLVMNATGTLTTASNAIGKFTCNGFTTTCSLGDNFTGIASKTSQFVINGTVNLNGKTLSGNSSTNRLLVTASSLGSGKTLTVSSGTFANADFRDITFANGGSSLDLSAITGLSGDAGGNTISGGGTLTLTSASSQTWQGTSGGSWSDNTKWTSRVPLPQDDVVINSAFSSTQTVTADMPRLGKSINWTGSTGSPTFNLSTTVTIYGSLTLISGMTFSANSGTTYTFEGRGGFTLTSNGKSFSKNVTVQMVGGTLTLQDAYSSTATLMVFNGTFNANNLNVTASLVNLGSGTATRALTVGTGTWTLTGTGTVWDLNRGSGYTVNATGSTISITDTSSSSKTFGANGETYNNLSITGGGTGAVIIQGSNTFANLPQVTGGTKTLTFTSGTTQTFTGGTSFGNGTSLITINSSSGGSTATFSKASGNVYADYVSVTDITAQGGAGWYVGTNSTDPSNSTGWVKDSAAPSGGSVTYTDGYYTTASVSLTVNDGTDSGSGINTSTRTVQRKSATLSNGSCGSYGSFSTISPTGSYPDFTDSTVSSGNCYQYQYLVSDNYSYQATYTSANTVKVDTAGPSTPGTPSTASETNDTTPAWTWTASSDSVSGLASTAYTVQWCTSSNFTGCDSNTTTSTTNSYTHSTALTDGTWYFRVRAADAAGNNSDYSSNGSFGLVTSTPEGSVTINSGSGYTNSSSVTLTISATDSIYASSNLTMKVSNLADLSDASYETYSSSKTWTLASSTTDGTKTVYIKFKNPGGNESSTYSDTITLDTVDPLGIDLSSPGNDTYTNSERPTFKWKATTDATAGVASYSLEVDNGDSGDFSVTNIPTSKATDYETSKYFIRYEGFLDSDSSNDYISLYTKHSIEWGQISENDGKLKEGKRSWKIIAYDSAGNTTDSSRTLYVDYTSPSLSSLAFSDSDVLGIKDGYTVTSNIKPTINGLISDNYSPDKVEVFFYKQNFFLGVETGRTLFIKETFDLSNTTNKASLNFSEYPSQYIDYGKYIVDLVGIDKAGNRSSETPVSLWLLSDDKAKLLLTQDKTEEEKKQITQEIREKSQISLPELEKKAILRREKEAAEFDKIVQSFNDSLVALTKGAGSIFSQMAYNFVSAVDNVYQSTAKVMPDVIGNTMLAISSFNSSTGNVVNETQETTKKQIAKAHKGSSDLIARSGQALSSTYQSIVKPVNDTAGFFSRIKIGVDTFTAIVFDPQPTYISDVTIEELGKDYAVVSWKTNHYAWGKVNFGTSTSYGEEVILAQREKFHRARLNNLKPGEKYYFEVMSQNKNYAYDAYYTFETQE